jgi:16S rRNA G527 N7-methylase RsmG
MHFVSALKYVDLKAGEVFWDIGCGAGIPNMAASIFFPEIKASKGVEYIDDLYQLALNCQQVGTEAMAKAGLN